MRFWIIAIDARPSIICKKRARNSNDQIKKSKEYSHLKPSTFCSILLMCCCFFSYSREIVAFRKKSSSTDVAAHQLSSNYETTNLKWHIQATHSTRHEHLSDLLDDFRDIDSILHLARAYFIHIRPIRVNRSSAAFQNIGFERETSTNFN